MRRKTTKRAASSSQLPEEPAKKRVGGLIGYGFAFAFGAVLAGGIFFVSSRSDPQSSAVTPSTPDRPKVSNRTVSQLIALSDSELEKVDIVEINVAVAREIPGLEKLHHDHYRQIVDRWTGQFRRWLPSVMQAFYDNPSKYEDDVKLFRLGMLAQFLDQQVGIAYVEQQKQAVIAAKKSGKKLQIAYTDPRDLFLYGLIDTKRGTCGTMPTLHVAIGRRLDWPVGLACSGSHYLCRYDDGKVVYNIEATDTGRGGFAADTDQEYIASQDVSPKAIAVGSDLRKLSAREMLGVFIQARGRHFADIGKARLAAIDYALAHTLFPNSRKIYIGLVGNLMGTGEKLFTHNEHGHPASLGMHLAGRYRRASVRPGPPRALPHLPDWASEVERINAINRSRAQQMMMTPTLPQPYQPPVPGQPYQPQPYR